MTLLSLNKIEIVGGLVGDALDNVSSSITNGIIDGFKYVLGCTAQLVIEISTVCVMACEIIFCASKESKDKGKIVKYILIRLGAGIVARFVQVI